jgi:hypothetical protein
MPLNFASLRQMSGWRFLLHRPSVVVGGRIVRRVHDPLIRQSYWCRR